MARARGPKSYFEPWIATRSKSWESAYRGGPPPVPGDECDVRQAALDWEAKRARAEGDADWIVWGSRMAEPSAARGYLSGQPVVFDDRRIIAAFSRKLGLPDGSPDHGEIARRVVACVNACAGITDPERFVSDVRALLLEYASGEVPDPREDERVTGLLARCIPPEELEEFNRADCET